MRCKECGGYIPPKKSNRGLPKEYCSERCRKRRWDSENSWRYRDECPSCGGLKMIVSKFCRRCMKPNNPTGINGR